MKYPIVDQANNVFLVDGSGVAHSMEVLDEAGRAQAGQSLLHRMLGLREAKTLERLSDAVRIAIADRISSVVLWRGKAEEDGLGRLITVRPAREPGRAIVAVDRLDAKIPSVAAKHLRELFGLSKSEAEIAMGLAEDLSVSELALARGVQIETIRGQIKTLLRKMGLTSQKQLVRVITRIAAALE